MILLWLSADGNRYLDSLHRLDLKGDWKGRVSETTYEHPGLFLGPNTVCEGMTWSAPAVNVTEVLTDPGEEPWVSSFSEGSWGEVQAVNETITVRAGTFDTVRLNLQESPPVLFWFDMESGVEVKQEQYDQEGNLMGRTELVSLETP